jgi:hypothetical protein
MLTDTIGSSIHDDVELRDDVEPPSLLCLTRAVGGTVR